MEITLQSLRKTFENQKYICEEDVLVTVYLAIQLGKPLLVEGAPGVGKTEIAKVLAAAFQTELIRLQCYEGLDESKALYEWNYQKQLIHIQAGKSERIQEEDLFSEEFLLERPLLKAIRSEQRVVLLIDEVDKTDEAFEAFLFELLSDFQVSIPEMGTIKARHIPAVILTSNATRELSDGLKRRCAYLYIGYPSREKELQIIREKLPQVPLQLAQDIAVGVYYIRKNLELIKPPSIAETLDWAKALLALGAAGLYEKEVRITIHFILKNIEDIREFETKIGYAELQRTIHNL